MAKSPAGTRCYTGVIDQTGSLPDTFDRKWTPPSSHRPPCGDRPPERRQRPPALAGRPCTSAAARHRSGRPQESGAVHQSRTQLARVQRARADPGARHHASAARAREVPRDHRDQPRRVLHDSRLDDAEEAARGHRGRRAGRVQHRAAAGRDAARAPSGCCWIRRRSGTSCGRCSRPSTSRSSSRTDWTPEVREYLSGYFSREICPVLTPLAFDPGHPFPFISNLSKNFAVVVRHGEPHQVRAREGARRPAAVRRRFRPTCTAAPT